MKKNIINVALLLLASSTAFSMNGNNGGYTTSCGPIGGGTGMSGGNSGNSSGSYGGGTPGAGPYDNPSQGPSGTYVGGRIVNGSGSNGANNGNATGYKIGPKYGTKIPNNWKPKGKRTPIPPRDRYGGRGGYGVPTKEQKRWMDKDDARIKRENDELDEIEYIKELQTASLNALVGTTNSTLDSVLERISQHDDAEAVRLFEGLNGPGVSSSLVNAESFAKDNGIENNADLATLRARADSLRSTMSPIFQRDNARRAQEYVAQFRDSIERSNQEWDNFNNAIERNNFEEAVEAINRYRNLTQLYHYFYESGTSGFNGCTRCLEVDLMRDGPIILERTQQMEVFQENIDNIRITQERQRQVNELVVQANEVFPRVTAQMEQAAADYIQVELQDSQTIARSAVNLARNGASRTTVQILEDFARDRVTSINEFLYGFEDGIRTELATTAEVMRAIYSNPNVARNLARNVVLFLEGQHGRQIVAGQVADAALTAAQRAWNAIYEYGTTIAYGTAEERGHASGRLVTNIVIAIASGEVVEEARLGLEVVANTVTRAGGEVSVGNAINQGVRASEVLAPEIAAIDQRVAQAEIAEASQSASTASASSSVGQSAAIEQRVVDSAGVVGERITIGRDANQVYHAFRHIERLGLDRNAVQEAILNDLRPVASEIAPHNPPRQVIVNGIPVEYFPHRLPDGSINVGRIHVRR